MVRRGMKFRNPFKKEKREVSPIALWWKDGDICVPGYTTLDKNPEIMAAVTRIADLIGSITIHLMSNTDRGDVRIVNELSRTIDINPIPTMTRKTWIAGIVKTMLLYGKGNAVVVPHTHQGYIQSLEPIAAERVELLPIKNGYREYRVLIDGIAKNPEKLLHFVHNPNKTYLWKGDGITVTLKDIADTLKQGTQTEKAFLSSDYKPSIIIKVDAQTEEFASPDGRQKLIDDYIKPKYPGQPWMIPAEQFEVTSIKPLSLTDLAIADTMEINKRTIAAVLGVPPFVVGVGDYDKEAWNNFIQNTVKNICIELAQEITRKLIINPGWYVKFNVLSLMDWDLDTIYKVFGGLSDKGIVTGNEVRDRIGMSPLDGLDELRILENFIPNDMIGDQKKLVKEE